VSRPAGVTSRRGFLTVAGSTAMLSALACSSDGTGPNPPGDAVVTLPLQSDADVLKYALFLELLEEDFYVKAVQSGNLSGDVATLAASVRDHESAHVDALQSALGSAAFGSNDVAFDFGNAYATQASFLNTAVVLEQTGVGAYLGAIGLIQSKAARTTAGSIFTIEARHTAAFRAYANSAGGPVPNAFESPVSPAMTVNAVVATGFVTKGL
jgi:rubrerythrin